MDEIPRYVFAEGSAVSLGRAIPSTELLVENNIILLTGDVPAYAGYSTEDRILNLGSMHSDYNIIYNIVG